MKKTDKKLREIRNNKMKKKKIKKKNNKKKTKKKNNKEKSKPELKKLINKKKQKPTVKIEVSGHTDNVGTAQANQILSENRAKAVHQYLMSNGVQADRLVYKGYGETQPIVPNDNDEDRAKNRRTEFKIVAK